MEVSDDTLEGGEQKDDDVIGQEREEPWVEDEWEEKIWVTEEVVKRTEEDEKMATFLREKRLSENLARMLINTDLTDEHVRLLKILDFHDDDMDNLQNLWQAKVKASERRDSVNSIVSDDDSSLDVGAGLSPNSAYLREVLSKPLIQALREIVMKKPADPVEYLGHWLLHFRVCEERSMRRKQDDLEVLINREILKRKA